MLSKRANKDRQDVQQMLRLSDARYNELIYTEGIRYLELYMGGDHIGIATLEALPSFWHWWQRQWARLDAEFLQRMADISAAPMDLDPWQRAMATEFYDIVHNGSMLHHIRIARRILLEACDNIRRSARLQSGITTRQ